MRRGSKASDGESKGKGPRDSGANPGRSAAAEGSGGDEKRTPPERFSGEWFVDWGKTLVFAAIIFLVFRTFILATFVITSGSMEDTLLIGDFLLVNKVSLGSQVPGTAVRIPGYAEPEHGDIIVFRADHAPGLDIVKRTVGLPGDTVWMEAGRLFRNGEAVEEPYVRRDPRVRDQGDAQMSWQLAHLLPDANRDDYRPTRDNWGPLVIPAERYFMLGDNREYSLDSRYWGLVERRKMKGKPLFIYYSYDRNALKPLRFLTAMRPGRIGPSPN